MLFKTGKFWQLLFCEVFDFSNILYGKLNGSDNGLIEPLASGTTTVKIEEEHRIEI